MFVGQNAPKFILLSYFCPINTHIGQQSLNCQGKQEICSLAEDRLGHNYAWAIDPLCLAQIREYFAHLL